MQEGRRSLLPSPSPPFFLPPFGSVLAFRYAAFISPGRACAMRVLHTSWPTTMHYVHSSLSALPSVAVVAVARCTPARRKGGGQGSAASVASGRASVARALDRRRRRARLCKRQQRRRQGSAALPEGARGARAAAVHLVQAYCDMRQRNFADLHLYNALGACYPST